MSKVGFCEVGQQLKEQYEAALHGWQRFSLLYRGVQPAEDGGEGEALQLWHESLAERNAAADRMYLHRSNCPHCRRQR
jgi:hypothetical protein